MGYLVWYAYYIALSEVIASLVRICVDALSSEEATCELKLKLPCLLLGIALTVTIETLRWCIVKFALIRRFKSYAYVFILLFYFVCCWLFRICWNTFKIIESLQNRILPMPTDFPSWYFVHVYISVNLTAYCLWMVSGYWDYAWPLEWSVCVLLQNFVID